MAKVKDSYYGGSRALERLLEDSYVIGNADLTFDIGRS